MNKIEEYLSQDIHNPEFLFHGSPYKLDKVSPRLSHDSWNQEENIAEAVFLFPSFIKSIPYAFKDTIKANSSNLDWSFDIPNDNVLPIMIMRNVNNYETFNEAKLAIFEFIESWYNNIRIHSTLNYITPNEKYKNYITNLVASSI